MPTRRKLLIAAAALLAGGGGLAYIFRQREDENAAFLKTRPSRMKKTTDERLAELLAKKHLSPTEMQEFIELQNKRVYEPQSNEFVSKHTFTNTDVAARLKAIDWFAKCGEPVKLDLTMPVVQVTSWEEAADSCQERESKSSRLQAQNQLSGWLHVHAHAEFQEWNDRVDEHNRILAPVVEKRWKPFFESRNLPVKLLHATDWNVGSALTEESYLNTGHRCFFFHELLLVYEAGHFPCGWIGEWPEGKLVIY